MHACVQSRIAVSDLWLDRMAYSPLSIIATLARPQALRFPQSELRCLVTQNEEQYEEMQ